MPASRCDSTVSLTDRRWSGEEEEEEEGVRMEGYVFYHCHVTEYMHLPISKMNS